MSRLTMAIAVVGVMAATSWTAVRCGLAQGIMEKQPTVGMELGPSLRVDGFQLAAVSQAGREVAPTPRREEGDAERKIARIPETLDYGLLRVGSYADLSARIHIEEDDEWGDVEVRVIPPRFLKVNQLRVRGVERADQRYRMVELGLGIDTSRTGTYEGRVLVEYGARRMELPVRARVMPRSADQTKVLVITAGFGDASEDSGYYRAWFDLIEAAELNVSYHDTLMRGMPDMRGMMDEKGRLTGQLWSDNYEVILVVDGGTLGLNDQDVLVLREFVKRGGRLIVGASRFMQGSVPKANEILAPFGLQFTDGDVRLNPDMSDWRNPRVMERARSWRDAVLEGVEAVSFGRVTPIRVSEPGQAMVLIVNPKEPVEGLAAVGRDGGEVLAVGPALFFSWLGDEGRGTDNGRIIRNMIQGRARK